MRTRVVLRCAKHNCELEFFNLERDLTTYYVIPCEICLKEIEEENDLHTEICGD
jgi:hypothetical protein